MVSMNEWVKTHTQEDELEFGDHLVTDDEFNTSQKLQPVLRSNLRKNHGSLSPTIEQRDEDEEFEG